MNQEEEPETTYCTVYLQIYSQCKSHAGFWVLNIRGIGCVVKSGGAYYIKVWSQIFLKIIDQCISDICKVHIKCILSTYYIHIQVHIDLHLEFTYCM